MITKRLDGKALSQTREKRLKNQVASYELSHPERAPLKLTAVIVGDDDASKVYVQHKLAACHRVGFESDCKQLPANITEADLIKCIEALNEEPTVHGILVQLPLPEAICPIKIMATISPSKDVDGFHPYHLGQLLQGSPSVVPCTPKGIFSLMEAVSDFSWEGKIVTIVGSSIIVGKPLAQLCLNAKATPIQCHIHTPSLEAWTKQADVIISAAGHPKLIKSDMVKQGAVIIDVGINRTPNGLVGDCDYESLQGVASHMTPVPGGVGPMTVVSLLENAFALYQKHS